MHTKEVQHIRQKLACQQFEPLEVHICNVLHIQRVSVCMYAAGCYAEEWVKRGSLQSRMYCAERLRACTVRTSGQSDCWG